MGKQRSLNLDFVMNYRLYRRRTLTICYICLKWLWDRCRWNRSWDTVSEGNVDSDAIDSETDTTGTGELRDSCRIFLHW